ncbi:ATP-grasp fold amidoligase family protein [Mycobacterium sp. HM-7]
MPSGAAAMQKFSSLVAHAVPLRWRRFLLYTRRHRRLPVLTEPKRFSDKVNWRVLYDRRELLSPTCDKLAVKDLARRTAGDSVRIPRTLWSGTDLTELASVELPDQWILKPTHWYGKMLAGKGIPDIGWLTARTDGWLFNENWHVMGEWAYSRATATFLVEERIGNGEGFPTDYKIYVFDGVARYVLHVDEQAADPRPTYYDRTWTRVATRPGSEEAPPVPPPPQLPEMLAAAERIGAGFDFLRVDLYNVDGEVWFGETAAYPVSGLAQYSPATFDLELGRWWQLPELQ